jgi:hypothetical protein
MDHSLTGFKCESPHKKKEIDWPESAVVTELFSLAFLRCRAFSSKYSADSVSESTQLERKR